MSKRVRLESKKLFLFDLDGVLYKGKEKVTYISGKNAIKKIKEQGKKILILTNNSTESSEKIYSNLKELGFNVEKDEILTSSMLTGLYLKEKLGTVSYFLVGEKGLELELAKFGHERKDDIDVDVVVVGLDRFLSYEKLDKAVKAAVRSKRIVATHASRFYMSGNGPAIATGPILKAIEYGSSMKATVIGKPSKLMFELALKIAKCKKEEALMIGDQIDTDIYGASRAGIDSLLVMTGIDKSIEGTNALLKLKDADKLVNYL